MRWIFVLAVFTAAGTVAYLNHDELLRALHLMGRVSPWLLLGASAAIAGVYVSRGCAYRIPLQDMGYAFRRRFLARTALLATTAHHLIPTGGASGYAFITYAFHRRGVPVGRASILALVDTVSNSVALASLVVVVLVYLTITASRLASSLAAGLAPGLTLLAAAGAVYYLQRDRRRLLRATQRGRNAIARVTGKRLADAALERFVDHYYEGKRLITANPRRFLIMVAWQYAAVAFSCLALYVIFHALGLLPSPWVVFMGLVLAMAGVSVVAAPGGGGSFEVVMSGFFATQGIALADGIAATLLYRLVSFWLPALAAVPVVLELRRRHDPVRGTVTSR